MQKYANNYADRYGNGIAGALITVTSVATGLPVTIYTDDGVTPAVMPVTDSLGQFAFYVADGDYNITLTKTGLAAATLTDVTIKSAVGEAALAASAGSTAVGHILDATGAVKTTTREWMQRTISIFDFMTDAQRADVKAYTYTLDVTAAIQAALDRAASIGGARVTGWGGCRTSATLTINSSHVSLVGDSTATYHDVGSIAPGFSLKWYGTAGGTMMTVEPVAGASAQFLSCNEVRAAFIANGAGIGLSWKSVRHGKVDIFTQEFSNSGLLMSVVTPLGEGYSCQYNRVKLVSRQVTTTGVGLELNGDVAGNASFNLFERVDVQINNGDGIRMYACDNNVFQVTRVGRAPGGTGAAIKLFGDAGSALKTANGNVFVMLSPGAAPIISYGTDTYTYPAINNKIIHYDVSNGAGTPTVGTASTLYRSDDVNLHYSFMGAKAIATDGRSGGLIARGKQSATESLRIHNGSTDHIRISDSTTNEWGFSMDGSGNLRFVQLTPGGTAHLILPEIKPYGNLSIAVIGRGLRVAEGANAKQGTATLVAGTATVANTSVTANSRIFLTAQAIAGTQGALGISARIAGTSFTITSSNAADTSVVAYEIFEPA